MEQRGAGCIEEEAEDRSEASEGQTGQEVEGGDASAEGGEVEEVERGEGCGDRSDVARCWGGGACGRHQAAKAGVQAENGARRATTGAACG